MRCRVAARSPATRQWLFADMFGENPHRIAFEAGRLVIDVGGDALDGIPQGQKLRLPGMLSVPLTPASSSIAASLIWHSTVSPLFSLTIVNLNASRSSSYPTILFRISGIGRQALMRLETQPPPPRYSTRRAFAQPGAQARIGLTAPSVEFHAIGASPESRR